MARVCDERWDADDLAVNAFTAPTARPTRSATPAAAHGADAPLHQHRRGDRGQDEGAADREVDLALCQQEHDARRHDGDVGGLLDDRDQLRRLEELGMHDPDDDEQRDERDERAGPVGKQESADDVVATRLADEGCDLSGRVRDRGLSHSSRRHALGDPTSSSRT